MPNYVTNRLEINADRETVQNVMDFLKGETDEDSTPCYIDFNNIIPMPKDLLIEASTSGEFGMKYLKAMQRKPFNSPDDLKVIQWMEGLTEEGRKRSVTAWSIVSGKSKKVRLYHLVRVVYRQLGYKMECP